MPISDMNDALRKLKSPAPGDSFEAIGFLLQINTEESDNALWAYLWGPRYESDMGIRIVGSGEDFSAWYDEIVERHKDKRLRAIAARQIVAKHNKPTAGTSQTPIFKAAQLEYKLLSTDELQYAQAKDEVVNMSMDPSIGKELKELLLNYDILPAMAKRVNYGHRTVLPILSSLIAAYPDKRDPVAIMQAIDHKYQWNDLSSRLILAWLDSRKNVKLAASEKKEYETISRSLIMYGALAARKYGALGQANSSMQFLESMVQKLSEADAELAISNAADGPFPREKLDKMLVDVYVRDGNINSALKYVKSNPAVHLPVLRNNLMLNGPRQAEFVTNFLPAIYDLLDQGFLAHLWESGSIEVRRAMMSVVGEKWPANILVRIAEGDDKTLSAIAMQILAKRQQTNLLPAHLREPEL